MSHHDERFSSRPGPGGSRAGAAGGAEGEVPRGALRALEDCWRALAGNGRIPRRRDIDPRALAEVLEYCFVLERIAPGTGRIRLGGRHLAALLGMDVSGMPFSALFEPASRKEIQRIFADCCAGPALMRLELEAPCGIGRPALRAAMLLAPLTDDEDRLTRVIGCLQSAGRIGRAPRRLLLRAFEAEPLPLSAGPALAFPSGRLPAAGLREAPAPFHHPASAGSAGESSPAPAAGARRARGASPRPPLRLVVNNG